MKKILAFLLMGLFITGNCVAAMTVTDPGAYARFADQLKQLQTMQNELNKINQAMSAPYRNSDIKQIISMQQELSNLYGSYDNILTNWESLYGQDYNGMDVQQMLQQGKKALQASQDTILTAAQAQGVVFEQSLNSNQKIQQLQDSNWAGGLTPLAAQQLTNQALVELAVSANVANTANAQYQNAMLSYQQKQIEQEKAAEADSARFFKSGKWNM